MPASTAVCTLFEGDYHLGAAALINSLHAAGFRGRCYCGLRGPLPPWAGGQSRIRVAADGPEVVFMPQETGIHFANHKPAFMLGLLAEPAADAAGLCYFDPDIVVKCPWSALERWAGDGIGLCEDVNPSLPARHPLRSGWVEFLARHDRPVLARRERYFNSGFVGLPRSRLDVLIAWRELVTLVGEDNGSLQSIKHGAAHSLFHTPDQDALNLALMCLNVEINATGPEGMDFIPGGTYLSHAIGARKPWRGGFVGDALRGYPPSLAAKNFFRFVDAPIPVFSPARRRGLLRSLRLAAFLGRFYRRS